MRKRFGKKAEPNKIEESDIITVTEAALDSEAVIDREATGEDVTEILLEEDDDIVFEHIEDVEDVEEEDALVFEDIVWDEEPHEEIVIYSAEDEYEIEEYTPVVAYGEDKGGKEEAGSGADYAYEEEAGNEPKLFDYIVKFLKKLGPVDYVIGVTGIFVVAGALITGFVYTNAQDKQRQLAAYTDLGRAASQIELIGNEGLRAMHNAQIAKRIADELAAIAAGEEAAEDVYEGDLTYVAMDLSSVYKDLKIKFRNEGSSKLIPNIPFEVSITDPYNITSVQRDDNRVGVIHLHDIPAGRYQVAMVPTDATRGYAFNTSARSVTVSDTLVYRTIDIADEIKKESEINAALEDSRANETVTESVLVDTVEWVEASRVLVSEDIFYTYEEIDKSTIADPTVSASSGLQKWLAEFFGGGIATVMAAEDNPLPDPEPEPNPDPSPEPVPEPPPDPTPHPATGDTWSALVNQGGERVFVMRDNEYIAAVFADYFTAPNFYLRKTVSQPTYHYTGWQEMEGKTYFYDKEGRALVGDHVIRGV
ncbi:MAG: hypothetical protein LBI54_02060, partial [Lachnospiraceae bacterium]|nr:hypothetical protein [Lachnospiraceae bacterium]